MFGFGSSPDFHDTTHVIAQFDQGGMGLPGREFYLNDDAKSVEIRKKYVAYLVAAFGIGGYSTGAGRLRRSDLAADGNRHGEICDGDCEAARPQEPGQ